MYTREHKYRHLTPVFLIINNHCEFLSHTRKFTWLFLIEKPVLNAVFKLSGIQNQIIIRFGTKNAIKCSISLSRPQSTIFDLETKNLHSYSISRFLRVQKYPFFVRSLVKNRFFEETPV